MAKKKNGGGGGAKGNAKGKKSGKKPSAKDGGKKHVVVAKPVPHGNKQHGSKSKRQQQQQPSSSKGSSGLSKMQEEMRRRLDGGKFRMLNEQLYTTTGDRAFSTFQSEPELFDVYHQGFREMAEKWPVNPLDTFIEYIKTRPKAVVADFGCGDARLAESVPNKVHSFDLVSRKPIVTACNIANVPLPDSSIDIAVYCLALMGTSIREYILEVYRVLKPNGVLKVAEVKSRFENESLGGIQGFVDRMQQMGFDLKHRDERNKMFALFEFVKSKSRKPDANSVHIELKACEYKRR
uniref:Ribosomal RNA-processing protein 8 n=1 Tax=Globisporangium ultimum (strain ATCC 200006 / CBS 805.95 / DAOM BR144) TaxID=431595 RepID=K3WIZ9_GLOUD